MQAKIPAESVGLVKLIKVNETRMPNPSLSESQANPTDPKLNISGYTEAGQVLFNYQNPAQGFEQSFGINLKKYKAHQEKT